MRIGPDFVSRRDEGLSTRRHDVLRSPLGLDDVSPSPEAPLEAEDVAREPGLRRPRLLVLLYSTTIFLSSALLFLIQPMVAKMVLPRYGGVPAVWTTSMVFFQIALLGGYYYSHRIIAWAGVRRHAALHVPLLLVGLLFLPFEIGPNWVPPVDGTPIPSLLGLLAVSIGIPFFVVASSGPMLQRWFASTGHSSARDPYFLYAASNLGSLLGLLAYPVLLEPSATLARQAETWALGYGVLVVLVAACALTVRRSRGTVLEELPANAARPSDGRAPAELLAPPPTLRRRLRWIALAFVPSSLMLGVTTHLSNDIAPVPMLWVMPLSLYLLTFVFAFSKRSWIRHEAIVRVFPFVLLPLVLLIALRASHPPVLLVAVHLATFFVAALLCHTELARDRPPPQQLTGFYLLVSLGGVAGGLLNAIIAPLVFNSIAEYPAVLVLAALCRRPTRKVGRLGARWLDVALPVVVGLWIVVAASVAPSVASSSASRAVALGIPMILVFSFNSRRLRFALGVAAVLFASSLSLGGRSDIYRERTFFGVHRIAAAGDFHLFIHGNTVHGIQRRGAGRPEPLSYYHRGGPIGDVFAARSHSFERVAVVGLGTGSLACYGSPGQEWSFFEIDPAVARIARDPRYFTYLADCLPDARVVLGDARLSLDREGGARYDIVAVDAFNSDSIPVHLMTREAIRLYLSRLADDGVLAFHISNRYLDLTPVMADLARDAGLLAFRREDSLTRQGFREGRRASVWVVMARRSADLGPIPADAGWRRLEGRADEAVWSDDYSNILGVFKWR